MNMKRYIGLPVVLSIAAFTLTGCAQTSLPSPQAATYAPHPALSVTKLEEIDKTIISTIQEADASLDANVLRTRVIGPAATERAFRYQKKSLLGDANKLSPLPTTVVQSAIGQDTGFPRVVVEVMEAPKGENVQALNVIMQKDARSNWSLWASMQILSNSVSPAISTGATGAEMIAEDSAKGLVASPGAVVDAYIQLANTREAVEGFAFAEDSFRSTIAEGQDTNASALEGVGEASVNFSRGDGAPVALRTDDGGALVIAPVNYASTIHITDTRRPATIQGNKDIAIVATGEANKSIKITGTMTAHFSSALAFYVPPANAKDKTIYVIAAQNGTPFQVENS